MILADPTIPTDTTTNWASSHGWQIIAAVVLTIVAIALFRALPKWFFLVAAVIGLIMWATLAGWK